MEAAGADVVRVTSRSVIAALVLLAIGAASAQSPPAGSVRFTKRQLFVNPYESTAVGDLNRDGHPDIVYGAYWFAGPDFVPRTFRPNHVAKEYLRANSDHVLRRRQGRLARRHRRRLERGRHLVVPEPGAERSREAALPGRCTRPWEARLLAKTRGTMEMFALHDYDGDGTPELHSANYRKNQPLEVWRWTRGADGAPALTPFVLGAEGGGHGFAWGDVNGD